MFVPSLAKALVVPAAMAGVKSMAVAGTLFTIVVKLVPDKLLPTVLTIGTAVPITPFTVVVRLFGIVLVLLTNTGIAVEASYTGAPVVL